MRFGLRLLWREKAFSLTVLITLALVIGANTAGLRGAPARGPADRPADGEADSRVIQFALKLMF